MADFTVSTDIDSFLQAADDADARTRLGITDPTLESVTNNDNTTTNDITVGRLTTTSNTILGLNTLAIGGMSLSATNNYAVSIGGLNGLASGKRSIVLGGSSNEAIGDDSEVLGGSNSKALASFSTVVGGGSLSATNTAALAAGGTGNLSNGIYSSIIGGNGSVNNSNYSAIVGATNAVMSAGHNRSVILGGVGLSSFAANTVYVPNLDIDAGFKMSTGATNGYVLTTDATGVGTWQAAAGGPAGPSGTTLSGTTANNTQTEIFVDGVASSRMTIATNTTWMFSAMVAARSATESAGYKIEGVIKNDGGTTSLVGTAVKTVFAEEDATWDITVEADDTNDALVFKVTGDSADSVVWEVTVNKTEAS